jgi:hypothetical protein
MLRDLLDIAFLRHFVRYIRAVQPNFSEFERTDFKALVIQNDVSGRFRCNSHLVLTPNLCRAHR